MKIVLLSLLLLLFCSCENKITEDIDEDKTEESVEEVDTRDVRSLFLFQDGYNVYISKTDEGSRYINSIYGAEIGDDNSIGDFTKVVDLPHEVYGASLIKIGYFLYLIGGESRDCVSNSIYYTKINSDGSIGIGSDQKWELNPISLPKGRFNASIVVNDGRIFLIGGEDGSNDFDRIIHARIYQDGQLGQWYESPVKLPNKSRNSSTVITNNKLYVTGGLSDDKVQDFFVVYDIGEYGLLTLKTEITLPEERFDSLFLPTSSHLVLAGGKNSDNGIPQHIFIDVNNDSFIDSELAIDPIANISSSRVLLGDSFYYIQVDSEELLGISGIIPEKNVPEVFPGSGFVPSYTTLRWSTITNEKVMINGALVSGESKVISPPYTLEISSDGSDIKTYNYQKSYLPQGFMFDSHNVEINKIINGYPIILEDEFYLFEFENKERRDFSLSVSNLSNTSTISIFEKESYLYTPILSHSGSPILEISDETIDSLTFNLNVGKYYGVINNYDGNVINALITFNVMK